MFSEFAAQLNPEHFPISCFFRFERLGISGTTVPNPSVTDRKRCSFWLKIFIYGWLVDSIYSVCV